MSVLIVILDNEFELHFDVLDTPLAMLWADKMRARTPWPLDDPRRFYGFDPPHVARSKAETKLRECIAVINSHEQIIQREWTSIDDQDYLNYLHNIFERYHGLLDQQNTDWWNRCPDSVRKALADLNINVHRAESVSRTNRPRVTCTWFGMPKDTVLTESLMRAHGVLASEFGGVYLNYVEIGKTVEELSIDNDQYIGTDAFQPFLHYSADFVVRFYDEVVDIKRVYDYFQQHQDFFRTKGIDCFDDYRVIPWKYKVAQLRYTGDRQHLLDRISPSQCIKDIYFA